MSKKSFKSDNPAMQFITIANKTEQIDNTLNEHNKYETDAELNTEYEHNTFVKLNTEYKHNTDYKHEQMLEIKKPVKSKELNKIKKEVERKTKRVNLLLQPSVLENISKVATMKQTSVNNLINEILCDYAKKEKNTISKYNEIFK